MTSMSSREIVRRCIEFRDPPRIAYHFEVDSCQGHVWPLTDFGSVAFAADPAYQPGPRGEDEWGLAVERLNPARQDIGQVKEHPLAEGWEGLDGYPVPDYSMPARYAHLGEQTASQQAAGRYVVGHILSLFGIASALRGFGNWLVDHLTDTTGLCAFLDIVVADNLRIIDAYGRAGVDGVIMWDDMAAADRPYFRPQIWREIYLPRYRQMTDAIHERGMHFAHHCCGFARDLVSLFVEGGLDVLQLDQPTLMGIDWLGEQYGGKLAFWNPVDIQTTMQTQDPAAIADEAHHQVWALGRFGGGFMVKAYQQPDSVHLTPETVEAQYQAFLRQAEYPLTPYPAAGV